MIPKRITCGYLFTPSLNKYLDSAVKLARKDTPLTKSTMKAFMAALLPRHARLQNAANVASPILGIPILCFSKKTSPDV
jgi:hypothetical protein